MRRTSWAKTEINSNFFGYAEVVFEPDLPEFLANRLSRQVSVQSPLRTLLVARIGARLVVMHNTGRRLGLDLLNFAEEKRSRRREAWTEGWQGDRQARA